MSDFNLIQTVAEINGISFLIELLLVIIVITSIVPKIAQFCEYIGKPLKWYKRNDDDHEILLGVVSTISELQEKQSNDSLVHAKNEKENREELYRLMDEMRVLMEDMKTSQEDLKEKVDGIVERNKLRDDATIEEMCDRIEQKTRYYINIVNGIPEDEYDSFVRLYKSYEAMGGNHSAHQKYIYCMENLPIIPIEKRMKN